MHDHVEWALLICRFSFGLRWRAWIQEFISTTLFSMLVSGSPSHLFNASSGSRQGDPLSPFRFTIVVEALSAPFCKAKEGGITDCFDVGSGV